MPNKSNPTPDNPGKGSLEGFTSMIGNDVGNLKGRMDDLEKSQHSTITSVDKGMDCIKSMHDVVVSERRSNAALELQFEDLRAEWNAERDRQ